MRCENCYIDNPPDNIQCEFCGTFFNKNKINPMKVQSKSTSACVFNMNIFENEENKDKIEKRIYNLCCNKGKRKGKK